MKKNLLAPVVVGILVVGGLAFGAKQIMNWLKPSEKSTTQKNKVAEQVNVLSVDQRPYVQISPLADGHNIILIVKDLKKQVAKAEYELEYQSGTLLQGAFGDIDLPSVPAQEQVLLGSCSAGGKCSFHEDVQGGKLLLRFMNSDTDKYVLKSDWRYLDNKNKENQVASKDAKFQLTSPDLAKMRYVVVYNSPGYPEGLKGTPVSDAYSLAVSSDLAGTGDVTIRATEGGDSLKLMGYDGKTWKELKAATEDKTVTATGVDLMELYVVVK